MTGSRPRKRSTGGPPVRRVDPTLFRNLMARWATGVSVVTASEQGQDFGLTVNALLSVSLSPPSVLVSVTHDADSTPVIRRTGRFGVNVLAYDQRSVSERFAQMIKPSEKFLGIELTRGAHDVPLLPGVVSAFECRVARTADWEDHVLIIGEVETAHTGRDVPPLVFYHSGYAEAEPPDKLWLPPRRH